MSIEYIVVISVCLLGAVLQALIGFGFPIIAMIFFSMIFPMQTAVTICQTAGIAGVAYLFFKYIRYVQWKTLLPFLSAAVSSGVVITWCFSSLESGHLKFYMGIVLCLIALFMLAFEKNVKIKVNPGVGVLMGLLSGAMNGFFAIGGPPVALYMMPATDDKLKYVATVNAYFFIFKVFSLPIRFTNGSVGMEHIKLIVVSIMMMTMGTLIGERIMLKINKDLIQKLVYGFVFISGVLIVVQELI